MKCEFCNGNIIYDNELPSCDECGRIPSKYHSKAKKLMKEEDEIYKEMYDSDTKFKKHLRR